MVISESSVTSPSSSNTCESTEGRSICGAYWPTGFCAEEELFNAHVQGKTEPPGYRIPVCKIYSYGTTAQSIKPEHGNVCFTTVQNQGQVTFLC